MTPARPRTLVAVAAAVAVVGWILLDTWTRSGGGYLPLPWTVVPGTGCLAMAVVAAGLPVRRWVRGERDRPLDPIAAARTVVLAKASAYGGAALAGWYLAQAVELLPDLVGVRQDRFVVALLAALAALAVVAAGLLVQRWCRLPPGDDGRDGSDGPDDERGQGPDVGVDRRG